jgi:hypothetical protein
MKPGTMKPIVAARRMAEAAVSVGNTNQIVAPLGPQLQDTRRVATAMAVLTAVVAALEVVAAAVVAVVAAAKVQLPATGDCGGRGHANIHVTSSACVRTMCGSRTGGWSLPGVMSD